MPSKTVFFLLFVFISFSSFSQTKEQKEHAEIQKTLSSYEYFDEDGTSMARIDFELKLKKKHYWIISDDSLKTRKLTPTKKKGIIKNYPEFIKNLEFVTNTKIEADKPIIIIYHPGADPCNTSGSATRSTLKTWHNTLKKGTKRIADTEPIYICKNFEGLKKYGKILDWHKDIGQMIEKLFFEYHYPCSSFVVINKKGKYSSSFGEFGKEAVWHVLKRMK